MYPYIVKKNKSILLLESALVEPSVESRASIIQGPWHAKLWATTFPHFSGQPIPVFNIPHRVKGFFLLLPRWNFPWSNACSILFCCHAARREYLHQLHKYLEGTERLIRFPQGSSSLGWTNPTPSTFPHTTTSLSLSHLGGPSARFSPVFWSLCWSGEDTALQAWLNECHRGWNNPIPRSAGCALAGAAQDPGCPHCSRHAANPHCAACPLRWSPGPSQPAYTLSQADPTCCSAAWV